MSKKIWFTQNIKTTIGENCALRDVCNLGQRAPGCRGKLPSVEDCYCKTVKRADGTYGNCPLDDNKIVIIATSYENL